ncbi:hypothetical protein N7492_003321 [Penicillium capsulatum]|uniref:WD40 repeat domain-containing protein n=1 Tax=Penicillium capsulatum TaxID=69766 RepID=A0A9W9IMX0_9EURO|nr:hypothetical protein N7492_003321 [Penicillium capsulatum]KAJ6122096.1 hypothetical protein N7512_004561 [Penicillium capsulatum]
MRTITRYLDGTLHIYQVTVHAESLTPVASYSINTDDKELNHAIAPGLERLVYATNHSIVCLDQKGNVQWRYAFEPASTERWIRPPECAFSLDGAWLWVYRPDAMNDRGPDLLAVLHASTGQVAATIELDSVGEAGWIILHPDGRHILLGVGEGQDGGKVYLATLSANHDRVNLHHYGWNDRALIDISPDGNRFMTVDHGRDDVAFHAFPSGEVMLRLPVAAFNDADEEALIDYTGGFIHSDIAVVTLAGETDDEEWHRHYPIDLHSGQPQGSFEAHSQNSYDFEPLGDGTWIVSDESGRPVRLQLPEM